MVDLGLAGGLVLLSGYVASPGASRIFFATTYPASAPLACGAARGRIAGISAGFVLGIALALERQINGLSLSTLSRDQVVSLLNGAVYYLLAGGAVGVVRRTIDRSEEQMRAIAEERERARERAAEARADARANAVWLERFKGKALDLHRSANNVISLAMGLRIVADKEAVSKSDLQGLVSTALQAEGELSEQIKRIREAEFPQHSEGTASSSPRRRVRRCTRRRSRRCGTSKSTRGHPKRRSTGRSVTASHSFPSATMGKVSSSILTLGAAGPHRAQRRDLRTHPGKARWHGGVRNRPGGGTDVDMRVPLAGKPSPREDMPGPGA